METVALDPLAAILAAPEGRYEWAGGSLVEMSPPPSFDHNDKSLLLAALMRAYAEHHGLGQGVGDNFALHLGETVRVPDAAFFKNSSLDRVKPTHCEGGADLVVEIVSPGSQNQDRGDKFYEYEAAGVEEYWIVDPRRRSAEFYRLTDGLYAPVLPDAEGRIVSSALAGFALRVAWLWERPKLMDALRELGLF